jgi:hypothetical protein
MQFDYYEEEDYNAVATQPSYNGGRGAARGARGRGYENRNYENRGNARGGRGAARGGRGRGYESYETHSETRADNKAPVFESGILLMHNPDKKHRGWILAPADSTLYKTFLSILKDPEEGKVRFAGPDGQIHSISVSMQEETTTGDDGQPIVTQTPTYTYEDSQGGETPLIYVELPPCEGTE